MARFCSLFSSSRGNCTYIGDPHAGILIDCGVSAKRIDETLSALGVDVGTIQAIFITHEHSDHICGLRVFASRHHIPVYASAGTVSAMENSDVLNGSFPVGVLSSQGTECAGMFIRPFPLSHDARQPVGYRIETADGRSISVATDTGVVTQSILSAVSGSDLILLESNHDIGMLQNGPYPYATKRRILSDVGHLSNDACAETAARLLESGTTRFCLAHLSRDNNMRPLAYQCTQTELELSGAVEGTDYLLSVAGGSQPEMVLL
ncbi:MAG: MBL fold metallo-hydrolase [Clostridia bacterium]|nr:MBL fold metallo-hydrolase [Clostridia bacterium]